MSFPILFLENRTIKGDSSIPQTAEKNKYSLPENTLIVDLKGHTLDYIPHARVDMYRDRDRKRARYSQLVWHKTYSFDIFPEENWNANTKWYIIHRKSYFSLTIQETYDLLGGIEVIANTIVNSESIKNKLKSLTKH